MELSSFRDNRVSSYLISHQYYPVNPEYFFCTRLTNIFNVKNKLMEQTSTSVFNKTDWHHIISPDDYVDNASLPYDLFDDMYHIGIFGMSRCGKGNMIARLFQHYWLHKIDAHCIYIFSPTFNTDITFSSIRHYL